MLRIFKNNMIMILLLAIEILKIDIVKIGVGVQTWKYHKKCVKSIRINSGYSNSLRDL